MTVWERLGIDRTPDIKVIKRAYAKQLKIYHPEDDPEGYQLLREAFDTAISYAKRQETLDDDPDLPDEWDTLDEPDIWNESTDLEQGSAHHPVLEPPSRIIFPHQDPEPIASKSKLNCLTVDDFVSCAIELYDHFPSRISIELWMELLHSDVLWNMGLKQEASLRLLKILPDRKFLPSKVWHLLNHCFGWKESFDRLGHPQLDFDRNLASVNFRKYFVKQLDEPGMRFEYLLQAEQIQIDLFLSSRYEGYEALQEDQLELAGKKLKHAYSLFSGDPDLLRLLVEYYLRIEEYGEALAFLEQLIAIVPEEIDAYLYKARLFHHTGQYVQAIETGQFITSQWPSHKAAKALLSNSYLALAQYPEALDTLRINYNLSADDASMLQPTQISYLTNKDLWIHFFMIIITSIVIAVVPRIDTFSPAVLVIKRLVGVLALITGLRSLFLLNIKFGKIRKSKQSRI